MIKWLRHKPEVDLKFDNLLLGHGLQKYDLDDLVHIWNGLLESLLTPRIMILIQQKSKLDFEGPCFQCLLELKYFFLFNFHEAGGFILKFRI